MMHPKTPVQWDAQTDVIVVGSGLAGLAAAIEARAAGSDVLVLENSPFFGMRTFPNVHHTMGGVLIDTRARVLDLQRRSIAGFYAAGEVAGGVHGACRLGSCAITDCLVFGRIAGQNAGRAPLVV